MVNRKDLATISIYSKLSLISETNLFKRFVNNEQRLSNNSNTNFAAEHFTIENVVACIQKYAACITLEVASIHHVASFNLGAH